MRLRSSWAVLVGVVVALGVFAAPSTSAVTASECDTRANDTPSKLIPCIQTADLWNHMKAFQEIAAQNPGPDGHPSRNSGEPGYKASADYVANLMKQAGYNVTIQTYKFDYYAYTGIPSFSANGHTYVLATDWGPGQSTGTVSGASLEAAEASSPRPHPSRARRADARRPTSPASRSATSP